MQITQLENIYYFLLLFVVVGIYVLYGYLRNKDLEKLGDSHILQNLLSQVHIKARHVKFALLFFSILFSLVVLLHPKWDQEEVDIKEQGSEIILILDNSLSMLTEDVEGFKNRFELAKKKMSEMIDFFSDHKMGLILVARDSQIECPLTFNSELLKKVYLEKAEIAYKIRQGTRLSKGVESALPLFSEGKYFHKVIILFSDGEIHRPKLNKVLLEAKKNNVIIHTVGVGSQKGGYIPLDRWAYGLNAFKVWKGS